MSVLKKILYVEDDDDIRTVAEMALSSEGLDVRPCASAAEALAALPGFAPDLVLMDVMMPGMDGPAALVEMRKLPGGDVPVIFMTAKVQSQEIKKYSDLGAIGVVSKPFDPMGLARELLTIWENRSGLKS